MKYSPSHEWIRVEGTVGIVGITEHAKGELGDIVYAELPKVGRKVKLGEEVCVLESTKSAADLYAPMSGTIVAVNADLGSELEHLNGSPELEGWLYKIELSKPNEWEHLLTKTQYEEFIQ